MVTSSSEALISSVVLPLQASVASAPTPASLHYREPEPKRVQKGVIVIKEKEQVGHLKSGTDMD